MMKCIVFLHDGSISASTPLMWSSGVYACI